MASAEFRDVVVGLSFLVFTMTEYLGLEEHTTEAASKRKREAKEQGEGEIREADQIPESDDEEPLIAKKTRHKEDEENEADHFSNFDQSEKAVLVVTGKVETLNVEGASDSLQLDEIHNKVESAENSIDAEKVDPPTFSNALLVTHNPKIPSSNQIQEEKAAEGLILKATINPSESITHQEKPTDWEIDSKVEKSPLNAPRKRSRNNIEETQSPRVPNYPNESGKKMSTNQDVQIKEKRINQDVQLNSETPSSPTLPSRTTRIFGSGTAFSSVPSKAHIFGSKSSLIPSTSFGLSGPLNKSSNFNTFSSGSSGTFGSHISLNNSSVFGASSSNSPIGKEATFGGFAVPDKPSKSFSAMLEEVPQVNEESEEFKFPSQASQLREQEVLTGEEDELTLFSSRAKLHCMDGNIWKERGVGQIKLNITRDHTKSRLVMRADAVLRVILNISLFTGMSVQLAASEKYVRLNAFENSKPVHLAIKLPSSDLAIQLHESIIHALPSSSSTAAKITTLSSSCSPPQPGAISSGQELSETGKGEEDFERQKQLDSQPTNSSDVGSDINFKRSGLKTLLERTSAKWAQKLWPSTVIDFLDFPSTRASEQAKSDSNSLQTSKDAIYF
ncbi:hypothetical protein G9A89_015108 [Geosiphon pyriformis]|nr:hypothetical protein G9A89_015108 [Geosiphon pyriformis]